MLREPPLAQGVFLEAGTPFPGRPGPWGPRWGHLGVGVPLGVGLHQPQALKPSLPMQTPAAPASPSWLPSPALPRALPQRPPPGPLPGPRNCKELLTRGHLLSGWHTIYLPDCRPLVVLCDMNTDGGGWTVSVGAQGGAGRLCPTVRIPAVLDGTPLH